MGDLFTLMLGNSFLMQVANHLILMVFIVALWLVAVYLWFPPRLRVIWTGDTVFKMPDREVNCGSGFITEEGIIITIPNKIIVSVYFVCCMSALIFLP